MKDFEKPTPYNPEAQREAAENYQFTGNPSTPPSMRDLLAQEKRNPLLTASSLPLVAEATLASTKARVLSLIVEHAEAVESCDWDTFTILALSQLLRDLGDDVMAITTLEI